MNEKSIINLKTIFNKSVDRHIEGVIKADDENSLRLEIEEYVLTNEVEKQLESFLDAYNDYKGANGVWISGFFGSGKSHLLKMLALLLENRRIDDASALDLHLPKCGDNEILRGDLKRAVEIPSKSVLFNIDQKADVISKTQIDALLAVFVKVFDEISGYYGKQGHIAQFERDLDSRGFYEKFKLVYKSIAGRTWQKGREQSLLEAKNIARAYAQTTGGDEASAMGILDKYRDEYSVSIGDFAEQVYEYIKRQPANFRLNFFVDEVGQYIAGNIKLMTNLQTIAESLATKCRGRAWIIVTAQEDMGTVIGEMSKQQGNDFSKIQARFANRIKLTSADVEEVLQRRLLTKNKKGVRILSDIYNLESNNFKTLFNFADGSQVYRNFQGENHFINSYPFIPYQSALFQSAIQNLSQHNAFEGKYRSVGERSMLGVFQHVVIKIKDYEVGQLATFDSMFEGVRTALKSHIQQSIIRAEKNLNNSFAIRLLKTLFLVKYVKEFKPTVQNLCVLMINNFNQDIPALKECVEDSLNLLEQQTYVQRSGNFYEYLTDEEKDIEQEIKNTEVEPSTVAEELEKIVFDHIIKHRKIRYEENGQDYPFCKKLDDKLYGRENELAIHVISPFHENTGNESILQGQNMYRDELLVLIPMDERLVHDILMYKRTEKYIRQNISITQREAVKRILSDKNSQNRERYNELQQFVKNLMGQAKLFVAGANIEINSENAQTRVLHGFQKLISRTYPNLRMLGDTIYTESSLAKCLKPPKKGGGVFANNSTALTESEQELFAFIQRNDSGGVRSTLKNLLEKFGRKPYGWHYATVLCLLASLYAHGKIEIRTDGNLLEEDEQQLERVLRNTHSHGNVVLSPQVEYTASQLRDIKDFFEDFFDIPSSASEAKTLGKEIDKALQNLIEKIASLIEQTSQYPFLGELMPVLEKLKELAGKNDNWYLTKLIAQKSALFDMKKDVIDPVCKFMSGSQKDIFDNARAFVQIHQTNFAHIEGNEAKQLVTRINDPECFKDNRIRQIKTQTEEMQRKVNSQINAEISKTKEKIADLKDRICGMNEFRALNGEQQRKITLPFNDVNASIENQKLIAVIRDTLNRFEENEYSELLSQMTLWGQPTPNETTPEPNESTVPEYVLCQTIKISFEKAWLADEADVSRYLESMRKAFLEEINKGKRIQV